MGGLLRCCCCADPGQAMFDNTGSPVTTAKDGREYALTYPREFHAAGWKDNDGAGVLTPSTGFDIFATPSGTIAQDNAKLTARWEWSLSTGQAMQSGAGAAGIFGATQLAYAMFVQIWNGSNVVIFGLFYEGPNTPLPGGASSGFNTSNPNDITIFAKDVSGQPTKVTIGSGDILATVDYGSLAGGCTALLELEQTAADAATLDVTVNSNATTYDPYDTVTLPSWLMTQSCQYSWHLRPIPPRTLTPDGSGYVPYRGGTNIVDPPVTFLTLTRRALSVGAAA